MRNGSGLRQSCLVKSVTPAAAGVTTGSLSKLCFGLRELARHGAICRKRSASGSRRILASGGGRRRASGNGFSRRSATIPISNMSSSMHTRPGPPAWHRRKRGTQNQAIGRSRGGLTTKIMPLVDALERSSISHVISAQNKPRKISSKSGSTGRRRNRRPSQSSLYGDISRDSAEFRGQAAIWVGGCAGKLAC
jgi:hypothetical protein